VSLKSLKASSASYSLQMHNLCYKKTPLKFCATYSENAQMENLNSYGRTARAGMVVQKAVVPT